MRGGYIALVVALTTVSQESSHSSPQTSSQISGCGVAGVSSFDRRCGAGHRQRQGPREFSCAARRVLIRQSPGQQFYGSAGGGR
jgi:hypothetical protein